MLGKANLVLALISAVLLVSGAWLMPKWVWWILLVISIVAGVFEYIDERKQPYLHMVAAVFYVSGLVGVSIYHFWDERDFLVAPVVVMRVVYILMFMVLLGFVFVYWRAVTAFRYKRGNVDKEKLVDGPQSFEEKWERFRSWLKGEGGGKKEEIYLVLGEEVDEKR
ncbi:hypothetical protein CathTA2_0822 [Caldalkalibacillus thermarum TA2.A1]|uniref:Uncharacterized protein n=1 Tax=Caldalkalibacillus thermarum (strain TA2.A1) TaxID=986075 RepID=F5L4V9_CALTT|nr:hypothetical protein [Caldalkalibacillus thermarum]EGL83611.1 hypothetical protein CathTA2_0822 [Caldalkalibacillus thermarum TA2.A1]QZT33702.1 hypothetical protein HUR95_16005 [Caldalkalibacillus thermarum TA2.A1]